MSDVKELLERQARWQRTRQALSWPEKVRLAEQVRESVRQLRRSTEGDAGGSRADSAEKSKPRPT